MANEQGAGTPPAQSGEKPAEKPVEKPVEKPAEPPAGTPAEQKGDGKPGEETGSKAGTAQPEPKAPARYELVVPETGKALLERADLDALETIARASDWTNAEAQAALDERLQIITEQRARFEAAAKADPEIGGAKFPETQQLAQRVIDRVRPAGHARRDSFLAFMGRGGAGNHPEVLAFLADLGRQMSEDSPTHSRTTQTGSKDDIAASFYDHPTSKAAG